MAAPWEAAMLLAASPYLVHPRLAFQLTLAPIFLWGALLPGGRWGAGATALW